MIYSHPESTATSPPAPPNISTTLLFSILDISICDISSTFLILYILFVTTDLTILSIILWLNISELILVNFTIILSKFLFNRTLNNSSGLSLTISIKESFSFAAFNKVLFFTIFDNSLV